MNKLKNPMSNYKSQQIIVIKLPKIGNSLQKTERHKTKQNNQSRKRQTRQKLSEIKMIKLKYPIS